MKYGGVSFCVEYSKIINKCMETNTHLHTIGEAIITPLQKAGKTKGPPQNTRPLTLSNIKRKILSLITLRRIQQQVDNYTGPWQAAYKRGRSCGDLVWNQRMLTAVVMEKHWSFHKMGIDTSAVFDTIQRSTILKGGGQTFFRAVINSELGLPEVAPCMARTFGGVYGRRRRTGSEPHPAQIWSQK